jgi:hypothetical protein
MGKICLAKLCFSKSGVSGQIQSEKEQNLTDLRKQFLTFPLVKI